MATYSASQVDNATTDCFRDLHEIVEFPILKSWPEVDLRDSGQPAQSGQAAEFSNKMVLGPLGPKWTFSWILKGHTPKNRFNLDLDRRVSRFTAHLSFCSQDGRKRDRERGQPASQRARQTDQTDREQTDRPEPDREIPSQRTDGPGGLGRPVCGVFERKGRERWIRPCARERREAP